MLWLLLVLLLMAPGETVRLYLKDGTYQLATEYKVVKDRVSYLSSERGEWEELPLEMVDLARTKKEAAQHEDGPQGRRQSPGRRGQGGAPAR